MSTRYRDLIGVEQPNDVWSEAHDLGFDDALICVADYGAWIRAERASNVVGSEFVLAICHVRLRIRKPNPSARYSRGA
jgi:hypothetical protein